MDEFPIDNYDNKTVDEVEESITPFTNGIDSVDDSTVIERLGILDAVAERERKTKGRTTAIEAIENVRSEIASEAYTRGLRTKDDEPDEPAEDDADVDLDSDEDPVRGDVDTHDEDQVEEDTVDDDDDPDDDDDSDDDVDPREDPELGFSGADGSKRILVRNPSAVPVRAAGYGFRAGEVKDLVLNDRLRSALSNGELQTVRG